MSIVRSLFNWICGPHFFDVGAVLCIGIGFTLALSSDSKDISLALYFFGIAALLAFGRAGHWLVTDDSPPLPKPFLAVLLFGGIGVLCILTNSWIEKKLSLSKQQPPGEMKIQALAGTKPDTVPIKPARENRKTIVVNPASVRFDQTGELYKFRITNETQADAYTTMIMLRIKSKSHAVDDFAFDVSQLSLKILEEQSLDPAQQFGDIGGMSGPADADGNPFFLFLIRSLSPRESREVTLRLLQPEQTPAPGPLAPSIDVRHNTDILVTAEIASYSLTPTSILKKSDTVLIPFDIPERVTIDHAFMCYKRDAGTSACNGRKVLEGPTPMAKGKHLFAAKSWVGPGSGLPKQR
jgi:hypothetical protein